MVVQCICVVTSPSGDIKGVIELSQVRFLRISLLHDLSFLSLTNEPTTRVRQESEDSPTVIKGKISGLSKGKHAISVNVFGDLSEDGKMLGEHFNPFGKNHGAPSDDERHVGSLGNITAEDDKVAVVNFEDKCVKLIGPYSIIGRSIAIAEKEDDLGKGGSSESLKNGNCGEIIAAGVVGIRFCVPKQ